MDEMPGAVILANGVRGLQLADGGLRRFPVTSQILLLVIVCLAFTAGFAFTRRLRRLYRRYLRRTDEPKLSIRMGVIVLNPVVVNAVLAFGAHLLGIALLLVTLDFGLWGFISAPAMAASLTETMQEFAENER
ncbi:MAG TPA: hypothetical protein VIO94_11915, partial [Phenylobacterium sp.]